MLDDRTCVRTDPNPHSGEFIWTREHNIFGWTSLLGKAPDDDGVSPYAAAARATDLRKLPPTFISIGALDLFGDENIDYARRLMRAGVPVEPHVYPGAFHGFGLAEQVAISQLAASISIDGLRRLMAQETPASPCSPLERSA